MKETNSSCRGDLAGRPCTTPLSRSRRLLGSRRTLTECRKLACRPRRACALRPPPSLHLSTWSTSRSHDPQRLSRPSCTCLLREVPSLDTWLRCARLSCRRIRQKQLIASCPPDHRLAATAALAADRRDSIGLAVLQVDLLGLYGASRCFSADLALVARFATLSHNWRTRAGLLILVHLHYSPKHHTVRSPTPPSSSASPSAAPSPANPSTPANTPSSSLASTATRRTMSSTTTSTPACRTSGRASKNPS